MRQSNILDPIHDGLSALVWDNPDSSHPKLKRQHATWIKRTIYGALSKAGYTDIEKWLTVFVTGSLTTYQYSDLSDMDVSLFVDTKVFPEWSRAEMIGIMVGQVDGTKLPGTPFPMQDFVVPPGVKPTDLYKPGLRSGYSLDTDGWINPPERERVKDIQQEENGFYVYGLEMADKMERLLRYEPDKAVQFWHQLHKRRQRDQKAGRGDFTESNIAYKMLANRGLFPAISETSGEYIAKVAAFNPDEWVTDEPCYLTADALAREHPEWEYQAGHYVHPEGWEEPHAWVRHRGTKAIFDPTHNQFEPDHPSVMARPDESHYDRYHSWQEHPNRSATWADGLGDDDPLLWLMRGKPGWTRSGPEYIAKTASPVPDQWDALPFTGRPVPGHESKTANLEVEELGAGRSGPVIYDPDYHRMWFGGPSIGHHNMIEHLEGVHSEFPHHEFPRYEYGQVRGDKVTWYSPGFDAEDDVNHEAGLSPVDYDNWDFTSKTARPADPEWVAERYPSGTQLWHGTDMNRLDSIMQHGLVPWDEGEHGTRWEGTSVQPRPGHVYLAEDPGRATELAGLSGSNSLRLGIDPSYLKPENINPDEDTFAGNIIPWADDSGHGQLPLGEKADLYGVGNDPEETHQGIAENETLAYRGTIPPEAITPYYYEGERWRKLPIKKSKTAAVEYIPGKAHKGFWDDNDQLHVWPLNDGLTHDPRHGEDFHPSHFMMADKLGTWPNHAFSIVDGNVYGASETGHIEDAHKKAELLNRIPGIQIDPTAGKFFELESKTAAWQDWTNHIEPIAKAYEGLPTYDPQAALAWKELGDNSVRRAAEIGQRLNVQQTDNPEPYANHQEMFDDINRGRFQVSRANSEHPIWTPEQNVAFRTVHDVEGHHPTGGDFSWAGENQACGAHAATLSPLAQKALMTECLGQTGWAIHNGGFGPQKVGFMNVNPQTFSSAMPEGGFCHRHIRHGIYNLPHVAKTAAPRQLAKFVYSPMDNKLVMGEMGNEEGEKPTHYELAQANFPRESFPSLAFGHVAPDGFVDTYGRPRISLGKGEMNPYEAQWLTEEALRRAVPHSRFLHPASQDNPNWALASEPEVVYTGEPPELDKGDWNL